MNAAARLRQRLQWPRSVVAAIHVAALLLSASAVATSIQATQADSDTPFIVAQVLLTAAIPLDALAFLLAIARVGRTWMDVTMIPVSLVLLLGTGGVGWALCWAAGLGGERCWWEALDL